MKSTFYIVNGENGKKIWNKFYQKMEIFKFKNTNPLSVLPNVFLFKWSTIFIYKIWIM